jgi:hypothetical protein
LLFYYAAIQRLYSIAVITVSTDINLLHMPSKSIKIVQDRVEKFSVSIYGRPAEASGGLRVSDIS